MILEDVQARPDDRGVAIDEVGVAGIRHPISVWDRAQAKQDTIAEIAMSVALPEHVKGTHLSRFLEVLATEAGDLTQRTIPGFLTQLRRRLDAPAARLRVDFPYFLPRSAPVTSATALMDYNCSFAAWATDDALGFSLAVRVPVTSVCPCSKAISDYGAHNQRGVITVEVSPKRVADGEFALIWIEELIEVAEDSASSPVYPLLKRSDERFITMAAYENPVFVEDMVRGVTTRLRGDERIERFSVEAFNDESIHNHAAFARASWPPATSTQMRSPWD
jgi:GTP cyclohydrolase I